MPETLTRRTLLEGGAVFASFLAGCSKKKVPDLDLKVFDKTDKESVALFVQKLWEKTENGSMEWWDILNGPIPADPSGFSEGDFIMSDINSVDKCTTDLFDCFGVAITGISKDTRKLISGIAHLNLALRREKEVALKDAYEKAFKKWLGRFKETTKDEERNVVVLDSRILAADAKSIDEYRESARHLCDLVTQEMGARPQILGPKVQNPTDLVDPMDYMMATTDIVVFTRENVIRVVRPRTMVTETNRVSDSRELESRIEQWRKSMAAMPFASPVESSKQ